MRPTGGTGDGTIRDGGAADGTGIRGLTPSPSFLATEFSIVRLAGVSILRGGSIRLRSTVMDLATTITISALTIGLGDRVPITSDLAPTRMGSIADPDRPVADFALDRLASPMDDSAVAPAEEGSIAAVSMEAVAGFTAAGAEVSMDGN